MRLSLVFPNSGSHLPDGEQLRAYKYEFQFTCEDSKKYFDQFKQGEALFHDGAVDVKENNAHIPVLSLCIFPFIVRQFPPKGNPHNAQMCRPGGREFFPGLQWPPLSATIKQNRQSIQEFILRE